MSATPCSCDDVRNRLAKYGRRHDQLPILPAASFAPADTDAEAEALARMVRRQRVSGATGLNDLGFVRNRDLSAYDPGGPLPDFDPLVSEEHISRGRAQVRMHRDPPATARQGREPAEADKWLINEYVRGDASEDDVRPEKRVAS